MSCYCVRRDRDCEACRETVADSKVWTTTMNTRLVLKDGEWEPLREYGWECPRCGVIHAPGVESCGCKKEEDEFPKCPLCGEEGRQITAADEFVCDNFECDVLMFRRRGG